MLDDFEDFFIICVHGLCLRLHARHLGQPLGFAFEVVLRKVTALAHPVGVVRLVGMLAVRGHLRLPSVVIALVAHILGVLLLVSVRAVEYLL